MINSDYFLHCLRSNNPQVIVKENTMENNPFLMKQKFKVYHGKSGMPHFKRRVVSNNFNQSQKMCLPKLKYFNTGKSVL